MALNPNPDPPPAGPRPSTATAATPSGQAWFWLAALLGCGALATALPPRLVAECFHGQPLAIVGLGLLGLSLCRGARDSG